MSQSLVVGSGAIGSRVARQLVARGDEVVCVSRSGRAVPGARSVALDAADSSALASLASGAAAIFNCANPAYHRWTSDWPPIASAVLKAAEDSGASLVTLSNLYPYGRVSGPMTPETPLLADYAKARVRAAMWRAARQSHEAGRVRACEVRASDFIGPDAQCVFGLRVIPRLVAGKSVQVLGSLDQPHSWTYVDDVATTLVTCATRPDSWGRVWHAPTNRARTQREVIDDLGGVAGVGPVRASVVPIALLALVGLVNPVVRELRHTMYQFTAPFIIDDSATRAELGLTPTPWDEVLRATLAGYRSESATGSGHFI